VNEVGHLDLAPITVKLWDTECVAEELAPHLDEHSIVISLQNGVTKDDLLRQYLAVSASERMSVRVMAVVLPPRGGWGPC
jgi:ketopantoate reductase